MSGVPARRRHRIPPPLSELETEVMHEVWRRDEVTVRNVLEALNAGRKQRAYTTIMTIMSRLHEKGLLQRRRSGKTDVYGAVMGREEYLDARAKSEVDELVADYGDLALTHFARQLQTLDPKRREQLRKLAKGSP
jgi:BlaI family transcriptional regulator, penicillinase repressor